MKVVPSNEWSQTRLPGLGGFHWRVASMSQISYPGIILLPKFARSKLLLLVLCHEVWRKKTKRNGFLSSLMFYLRVLKSIKMCVQYIIQEASSFLEAIYKFEMTARQYIQYCWCFVRRLWHLGNPFNDVGRWGAFLLRYGRCVPVWCSDAVHTGLPPQ